MNSSRLLQGKRALVFGTGGTVGAAVAKEFAAEGAEVLLSGRNKAGVEGVKRSIDEAGGRAHAAAVNGLDETGVQTYVDGVVEKGGRSRHCIERHRAKGDGIRNRKTRIGPQHR